MTGTDLNISFQDTQYLSELYGKLGSLQYDLANFDMIELETRLWVLFAVGFAGLVIGGLLSGVVDDLCYRFDREYTGKLRMAYWIVWIAVVIAANIIIGDISVSFAERDLLRDINATEMAIEAIKMKYGLV